MNRSINQTRNKNNEWMNEWINQTHKQMINQMIKWITDWINQTRQEMNELLKQTHTSPSRAGEMDRLEHSPSGSSADHKVLRDRTWTLAASGDEVDVQDKNQLDLPRIPSELEVFFFSVVVQARSHTGSPAAKINRVVLSRSRNWVLKQKLFTLNTKLTDYSHSWLLKGHSPNSAFKHVIVIFVDIFVISLISSVLCYWNSRINTSVICRAKKYTIKL